MVYAVISSLEHYRAVKDNLLSLHVEVSKDKSTINIELIINVNEINSTTIRTIIYEIPTLTERYALEDYAVQDVYAVKTEGGVKISVVFKRKELFKQ